MSVAMGRGIPTIENPLRVVFVKFLKHYPWSLSTHGHTRHMVTLYTWSDSAHGHTLHMVTLCTWSHSAHGHPLHMITLYTWSHSAHGHTLHMVILYTLVLHNREIRIRGNRIV